ncbi:sensor histidine kinase [Aestuariispira insulae]|uniref:histidine kinase n=1 Tax=Aestuariispira insulae TaxID=1461337 RepID=A0A3D9HMV8_9PROT|nr:sensor histidine kinase [Aestuariispira insulae]RED50798.1 Na+/proline symporter [Aestuariispira insulae]
MVTTWLVVGVSFAYLGLLFAIAFYGDKRAEMGGSLAANPYIYTLSIAVFCTSWTFYGSVGLAAQSGLDFLPIYLGPTLVFILWSFIWIKIIRICKVNRITSIADFISARYGKSTALGGLVAIIAVLGTMPYISLQLKSIATSFTLLLNYPSVAPGLEAGGPFAFDTTLVVALALAVFAILFGTRHIDPSEHHDGMVAAIAFESVVKLCAFLAVGLFVTYGIHNGFTDLFEKAAAIPELSQNLVVGGEGGYGRWITMILLSMAAIICLPRQFHITVVENVDESHMRKAVWLFPLYLLVINIFVLPIALSGKMLFSGGQADADMFVLTLPIVHDQMALALFAFIGGLSAATSMVIVAAIALSTMVCNNLVMPLLIHRGRVHVREGGDVSRLLLIIRRTSILLIMLLGYGYFRIASESYSLVTIGLVSFAAAAQFAPAIIGGIFWTGAARRGAMVGLALGFLAWCYTLLLPSFAQSGWLPISFIEQGPWEIGLLKPYALFGLEGFDQLSHALFWSMLLNIGSYVIISLLTHQSPLERIQGTLFVDVFKHTEGRTGSHYWEGTVTVADLEELVSRFVGSARAQKAFEEFARRNDTVFKRGQVADSGLMNYAEKLLAGAIGSATARVMIGSIVKGEIVGIDEVYRIIDETSQAIEYSKKLEQKSIELEDTTRQLQRANDRLKELDALKDDFLSTISHELRTPLTSIRAFSEILSDNPNVPDEERHHFLSVIAKDSERLTRLIDQILDLAKMEAGRMQWTVEDVDPAIVVRDTMTLMDGLLQDKNVDLILDLPENLPMVRVDRDKFMQVLINLVSNAVKFCGQPEGRIAVTLAVVETGLQVTVQDNGKGVPAANRDRIFDKFHRSPGESNKAPHGTGLGLAICRQIITFFGGRIWVEEGDLGGAAFSFSIPVSRNEMAA